MLPHDDNFPDLLTQSDDCDNVLCDKVTQV